VNFNRREFLLSLSAAPGAPAAPRFETSDAPLQRLWERALAGLTANLVEPGPLLTEGGNYPGVWLECGPHESLVYGVWRPDVALANHRLFYQKQREDGQFPAFVIKGTPGYGQIQMVVPIAATAFETFELTGDRGFLAESYQACARWDGWLAKYRNTLGTGLCELFCEWDTGHDNSPRVRGLPQACPKGDAKICPSLPGLPRVAPDLSATLVGGRVALSKMALALGNADEAARWDRLARTTAEKLIQLLYDPETACFYDLDPKGQFIRIRHDALSRVMGEHVVSQALFNTIWHRQLGNPKAFWSAYPFPSIAMDDAAFDRPIPKNSWGGASQALTALRAPRWMEHYQVHSACTQLMRQWVSAIVRAGKFLQQMDPETGDFTGDKDGYSPAMLVLLDFVTRLYGVRRRGAVYEWNCSPGESVFESGGARLVRTAQESEIWVNGRLELRVRGAVRVLTEPGGKVLALTGTAGAGQNVHLQWRNGRQRAYTVRADDLTVVR